MGQTGDALLGPDTGRPPFRRVDETEIYCGRVLRLVSADFVGPQGEQFRRDVVRSPGAVAVVPILNRPEGPSTVLVRQFRPAIEAWLLEVPAGLRDKPDEAPEATAYRELIEETGYAAQRLDLLTVMLNAAGMTDQRTHIYLARDLTEVGRAGEGVEEAYLEVHQVPLADIRPLIDSGELCDAKTIVGLLLALAQFGL